MSKRKLIPVVFLSSLLLTGCGIKANIHYENGDSYSIGDATISDHVVNLNIDWINGDIEFRTHEEDTIEIKDDCEGTLSDDNKLRYLVEDDTLYIKFRKSDPNIVTLRSKKNLIVTIPNNAKYESCFIETISSDIKGFIFANSIAIHSVSGNANFSTNADIFSFQGVSGNPDITFSNSPQEIKVNVVSGNTKLHLPNCTGFIAQFSIVSGNMSVKDFEGISTSENTTKFGDESTQITLESTSGNAEISK